MRSYLLSFLVLLLLIAGFLIYWKVQPPVGVNATSLPVAPPDPLAPNPLKVGIGPGQRPWVRNYDSTQRLSSEFVAEDYAPQKGGTYIVTKPQAKFYLDDGQYIWLKGVGGTVWIDDSTDSQAKPGKTMNISSNGPSHGRLTDVRLELYPSQDATKPTLWLDVNNLVFDNDTLRLYTDQYTDEAGLIVPGDQVPVLVDGDDFQFQGRGLSLHWNERDRRLQVLEITHGKMLRVKNTAKLSLPGASQKSARKSLPLRDALASADQSAAIALAAAATAPGTNPVASAKAVTPYRAVFSRNVRVFHGEAQLATSDVMNVDFLPGSEKKPATSPTGTARINAPLAEMYASADDVAPPATPGSATQPVNEPITVYWDGTLRISALESTPILPLKNGQAVVQLVGVPAEVTADTGHVRAAAITYRTVDGAVKLDNSPQVPVVTVEGSHDVHITTQGFNYDPATSLATLLGKSNVKVATTSSDATTQPAEHLEARWTDTGVLHVAKQTGRELTFDGVDLAGNVNVMHPQFDLASDRLAMKLDTPAGGANKKAQPNLRLLDATGNVVCNLAEKQRKDRTVTCEHLTVATDLNAEGKLYPHVITADGAVHVVDPQQSFAAKHAELTLMPSGKSAGVDDARADVSLERLYASGAVVLSTEAGGHAIADELTATQRDGNPELQLKGNPFATLEDGKGSVLHGPDVRVWPNQGRAMVAGAGSLHTRESADETVPTGGRPVDVAWTKSALLDAGANALDIDGGTLIRRIMADKTVESSRADHMHVELEDDPAATRSPTTQSAKKPAASNMAGIDAKQLDLFKAKHPRRLTLNGNVAVQSVSPGANGLAEKWFELTSSKLLYDLKTRKMSVPGAGAVQFADHSSVKAKADDAPTGKGASALSWTDSLLYDDQARQVVASGNVAIVHQGDTKEEAPFTIRTSKVTAELTPASTTGPTTKTIGENPVARAPQLKRMIADGPVTFVSKEKGLSFQAGQVEYDPAQHTLTARGTEAYPLTLEDRSGSTSTYEEMVFDTKTQQIISTRGVRATIRK